MKNIIFDVNILPLGQNPLDISSLKGNETYELKFESQTYISQISYNQGCFMINLSGNERQKSEANLIFEDVVSFYDQQLDFSAIYKMDLTFLGSNTIQYSKIIQKPYFQFWIWDKHDEVQPKFGIISVQLRIEGNIEFSIEQK
ncbi:hypothetical protein B5M42_020510 [Paenibacillus athensensis]|uniref:Uncharacterized protein n=1 Tax=Paenibacillus athensensis TaxID=1967502 RepID=A0A4Y8PQW6_9BACL|nr:hypothetical protein [Paenibacillus athensensis]MCD1261185.1 hypothetical protein [Paenibacillus athensensis]